MDGPIGIIGWHAIPHTELFDGKIIIVCVKNTSWGEEGISYLIFRLIPDIFFVKNCIEYRELT